MNLSWIQKKNTTFLSNGDDDDSAQLLDILCVLSFA